MQNSSAKDYFSQYLADDVVRPLNHDLVNEILKYKPKSVFEFGCGQGKNLSLIKSHYDVFMTVFGIDVSLKAVYAAQEQGRAYVQWGDESVLSLFDQLFHTRLYPDVSFTCSVLDHIPEESTVKRVLADLKRLSKKAVILYETQRNTPSTYYYYHDYEALGFTRLKGYEYFSPQQQGGDGSTYHMYIWERKRKNNRNGDNNKAAAKPAGR